MQPVINASSARARSEQSGSGNGARRPQLQRRQGSRSGSKAQAQLRSVKKKTRLFCMMGRRLERMDVSSGGSSSGKRGRNIERDMTCMDAHAISAPKMAHHSKIQSRGGPDVSGTLYRLHHGRLRRLFGHADLDPLGCLDRHPLLPIPSAPTAQSCHTVTNSRASSVLSRAHGSLLFGHHSLSLPPAVPQHSL